MSAIEYIEVIQFVELNLKKTTLKQNYYNKLERIETFQKVQI